MGLLFSLLCLEIKKNEAVDNTDTHIFIGICDCSASLPGNKGLHPNLLLMSVTLVTSPHEQSLKWSIGVICLPFIRSLFMCLLMYA